MESKTKFQEVTNQHLDILKKRISTAFDEIDQAKYQFNQLSVTTVRIENLEAKSVDMFIEIGKLRDSIPPSAENMGKELKSLQIGFNSFK